MRKIKEQSEYNNVPAKVSINDGAESPGDEQDTDAFITLSIFCVYSMILWFVIITSLTHLFCCFLPCTNTVYNISIDLFFFQMVYCQKKLVQF